MKEKKILSYKEFKRLAQDPKSNFYQTWANYSLEFL